MCRRLSSTGRVRAVGAALALPAFLVLACGDPTPRRTLPSGTVLRVELLEPVSNATHKPGDRVRARLSEPVTIGHEILLASGSALAATVIDSVPGARVGGWPKLGLEFRELGLPSGPPVAIRAYYRELFAPDAEGPPVALPVGNELREVALPAGHVITVRLEAPVVLTTTAAD